MTTENDNYREGLSLKLDKRKARKLVDNHDYNPLSCPLDYLQAGKGSFEDALCVMRDGLLVRRVGWPNNRLFIRIGFDGKYDGDPTCFAERLESRFVRWDATHEDLLARDWSFAAHLVRDKDTKGGEARCSD